MKKLLLFPVLLLLVYCNNKAEPVAVQPPKEEAPAYDPVPLPKQEREVVLENSDEVPTDIISYIRSTVENINTFPLEKKHYEFMCDEKMMVDYFYDNGELVKVAVDFGTVGDVYAREGYYYDNGKLIFNYEFTEGGPACEGCIEKHEYRTYVHDDKAIKYIKDKNAEQCRTCEFGPKSRQYKVLKAKTQDEVKAALCH